MNDDNKVSIWRDQLSHFEKVKTSLWQNKRYQNKYVGIRRHEIVDVDDDKFSLATRVFVKFPDEVVLIVKVQATIPVVGLRSPRLFS